jgi:hypothetical protein
MMQELCLIAIVYLSQLRIYPFSAHSLSASISLVPLCFYLARSSWSWLSTFLSLSCSSAPSSLPRVFTCVKIVVYVLMWAPFCQVKMLLKSFSNNIILATILLLKTERDLIFLTECEMLTGWHELVLKTRRGLKMK